MSAESPLGRRLRFDLEMHDDESIPGAIARGVRDHVLIRTQLVVAAAGVQMKHIGYAQLATSDELGRLAYVARCRPEAFATRAGHRVPSSSAAPTIEARFGDLILPRAYLELDRRRIGPISLETRGHHRLSWMNRLLPYCPESFERMVDQCAACGAGLGWRFALGIGHCEYCGTKVAPSDEPGMTEVERDDYRLFARLSSPNGRAVEEIRRGLPDVLTKVQPGTLVRLALLAGGLVQDEPVTTTSRIAVVNLEAPILAATVAAGAALLRDWPTGFRTWVSDRTEQLRSSPEAIESLRAKLKRLAHGQSEAPDLVELVTLAVPNIQRHKSHGLAQGRRYYLYTDVQRLLGLNPKPIEALRSWSGIDFVRLNTADKNRLGQFDADQIDELAAVFDGMVAMNSCAVRLKLPFYAIEQLCGAGLLEWEDHEAALITKPGYGVRGVSLDRLESRLINNAQSGSPPVDYVPFAVAMKRIGGRLKPWSAVIQALERGRFPFWITGDKLTTRSLLLHPKDIAPFDRITAGAPPRGLQSVDTINQSDAAEVLNVSPIALTKLGYALDISFKPKARGLATSSDQIVSLARRVAWSAEIRWHLQVGQRQVEEVLLSRRVKKVANGWCRRTLIDEGVLPPFNEP